MTAGKLHINLRSGLQLDFNCSSGRKIQNLTSTSPSCPARGREEEEEEGGCSAFWEQCIHIRTVPYTTTTKTTSYKSPCNTQLPACLQIKTKEKFLFSWDLMKCRQQGAAAAAAAAPGRALEQGTSPTTAAVHNKAGNICLCV